MLGAGAAARCASATSRIGCIPWRAAFSTPQPRRASPSTPILMAPAQEGVGVYQINVKNGWRISASKAFLRPAAKRANVRVLTETLATRIVFEGRRACGVEIRSRGETRVLRARGEVIVSAGAVNSPQLLQISGIGPAAHLGSIGVAPLCDSPAVGSHLQDHIGINYTYRSRVETLNDALRSWRGKLVAGLDFLIRSRGPLSLSLNQAGGFVRSHPGLARPDIQLYLQAISTVNAKAGTRPLLTPDPFSGFSLGLSNCRPTSRGSVLAKSTDPLDPPRIAPNALATPEDVEAVLAGVKLLRRLARRPALAEVIEAELAPGPDVRADEDLIEDFRRRGGTVYHPVGTCRMAPNRENGAVDLSLRVHGVGGLRVVDASVFPTILSGNVNAPVMMTAAKAAAAILADAR